MATVLNKPSDSPQQKELLPLVAIREGVVFPHTEQVLVFGRRKSVAGVTSAFQSSRKIIFVTQINSIVADPKPEDVYKIGTLCVIERTLKTNGEINAIVKGINRVKITNINTSGDYLQAEYTALPEMWRVV